MNPLTNQLPHPALTDLPDGEVLVLPGPPADGDALASAWKAARDEAISAYQAWCQSASTEAFTVYQAAADREDAAASALAGRASTRRARWYRVRTSA